MNWGHILSKKTDSTEPIVGREEKMKAGAKHFSRDFTYAIDQLSRE